jgi:hypothetical protein
LGISVLCVPVCLLSEEGFVCLIEGKKGTK